MIGPWVADLSELQANGVTVNGRRRAVRLFINGDYAFLSTFCGHKGASSHMSCLWCLAVRRPSAESRDEATEYGSMQRAEEAPRAARSRDHLLKMMADYAAGDNDTLPVPHRLKGHLSIDRRPNFAVGPEALVPVPLHATLGWTGGLLQLGITAATARGGHAAGLVPGLAIGISLLEDVRVRPVPNHGGGFEERSCHLIAAKGQIVCDALAPYVSAESLLALRSAWTTWATMVGVLNRAEEIPGADITAFEAAAATFVPRLQHTFPWLSVTVKLHSLAHHVPDFLRR